MGSVWPPASAQQSSSSCSSASCCVGRHSLQQHYDNAYRVSTKQTEIKWNYQTGSYQSSCLSKGCRAKPASALPLAGNSGGSNANGDSLRSTSKSSIAWSELLLLSSELVVQIKFVSVLAPPQVLTSAQLNAPNLPSTDVTHRRPEIKKPTNRKSETCFRYGLHLLFLKLTKMSCKMPNIILERADQRHSGNTITLTSSKNSQSTF